MHVNARMIGAGVAATIAASLGYALFFNKGDEVEFDAEARDGPFSVRSYPAITVVETIVAGTRQSAEGLGFLALADFLGGERRGSGRLAVAAPLLVDGDEDGRGWRTRLILPPGADPEALPQPAGDIRIRALPARRVAAVRFSGEADDAALAGHETDLRYWMETNGLHAGGPVEHAFYHAPMVPAMLRRTEVMIPLAA